MPLTARIVYPSLSRVIVDSSLILGRTLLVTGLGLGLLIGFAMLIAFGLTTGVGFLGYDASTAY